MLTFLFANTTMYSEQHAIRFAFTDTKFLLT